MTFKRKLYLFVSPSWISFICSIILSISFIGISSFLFAEHSGKFGTFQLGSYIESSTIAQFSKLAITILSSTKVTSILFVVFWIILGFIIYNIIFVLKSSADESVGFFQGLTYVNAKPGIMSTQVIGRFFLLAISLILWVLFALYFSWMILPNALSYVSRSITGSQSPAYVLVSFLLVLAASHIATMLLRFTFLRARLSRYGK